MTGLAFDLWDALMALNAGRLQRDLAVRCNGSYD
jgi:hypothetical protein